MIEVGCQLCEDTRRTVLFPANFDPSRVDGDAFVVKGKSRAPHYQINRCEGCGMIYSSPLMEPAVLARLYREFRHENTGEREVGNVTATSRQYYALARPHLAKRERVLDIGCDIGLFLASARADGFSELYGIEPNRRAAEQARAIPGAKLLGGLYEEAEFPDGHFDLISMVHVLDHLIDVNDTLRHAWRHLAQGGVIVAVVHNVDCVLSRLLGERFPPFNIQHNHFFSKMTLRRLFLKHGFAVADVRTTWNRYSLGYFIENLPAAPAPAKKRVARWADAVGLGGVPLTVPLGNIGIVARRPA
ncbi:MAG: class I SAM-dependent methyltransferase [Candidatus Rokubacteria bacterium]|nr:class I SAM-dependent methyltransferase [Candidatus Rokubacteria bacterium]